MGLFDGWFSGWLETGGQRQNTLDTLYDLAKRVDDQSKEELKSFIINTHKLGKHAQIPFSHSWAWCVPIVCSELPNVVFIQNADHYLIKGI